MGSMSFKAGIRRLWTLLKWQKGDGGGRGREREREMVPTVATELSNFDAEGGLSYTSLRDLIPRGAGSWRSRSRSRSRSWSGLALVGNQERQLLLQEQQHHLVTWHLERPRISNNLVELAARAYLQPAMVQREPPRQFLQRLWMKLTAERAAPASAPAPAPAPAPPASPPPATRSSVGLAGLVSSWVSFNLSPSLSWIRRMLRHQPAVMLRN